MSIPYPEINYITLLKSSKLPSPVPPLNVPFISDETIKEFSYDFEMEKMIIQRHESYQTRREALSAVEKELLERRKKDQEEREKIAKQIEKEAANRRAPGLNSDGSILLPTIVPTNANGSNPGILGNNSVEIATKLPAQSHKPLKKPGIQDNLSEFDAIAPPDPWEYSTNDKDHDIRILSEVMSSNSSSRQMHPHNNTSQSITPNLTYSSPGISSVVSNSNHADSHATHSMDTPPPYTIGDPVLENRMTEHSLNTFSSSKVDLNLASLSIHLPSGSSSHSMTAPAAPTPAVPPRPKQLSSEEEKMHAYLQMGFTKDAVSRGIRLFPIDDKKLIEFLIPYQELVQTRSYPGDIVEMGLTAYSTDTHMLEKTKEFIEAFLGLRELGFAANEIRDALISAMNRKEDALEILINGKNT